MRKMLNRIKKWWNSKDYRGKGYALSTLNIFLMFGLALSYFTIPIITMIMSLSLITSSLFSIHYITKQQKIDAQKLEETEKKLKKEETSELIKKEHEKIKMDLDKDTREAMELLFNSSEKEKKEPVEETVSSNHKGFNQLFN